VRTTAESLAALDRLERAQSVRARAGWSPGRALAHCAQSVELSLTGYPQARSALFRATAGRVALRVFLSRGAMSHDLQALIPGAPDPGEPSLAEGLARLRAALQAFTSHAGPVAPHFAYGPVSKAEYEALHAMHLTDHLSQWEVSS
jgi:hypothetical protein